MFRQPSNPRGAPSCSLDSWDRRAKLLADAQRMAKATFKQRSGWLLPEGGDRRDITIKRLRAQLAEMVQILVDIRLMKPPQIEEGEPSRGRPGELRDPPRRTRREKRHESHVDLESKGDTKFVASSKSVTMPSLLKCRPPRNAQCQENPRR